MSDVIQFPASSPFEFVDAKPETIETRDFLAAQALQALILAAEQHEAAPGTRIVGETKHAQLAREAYLCADALMIRRSQCLG